MDTAGNVVPERRLVEVFRIGSSRCVPGSPAIVGVVPGPGMVWAHRSACDRSLVQIDQDRHSIDLWIGIEIENMGHPGPRIRQPSCRGVRVIQDLKRHRLRVDLRLEPCTHKLGVPVRIDQDIGCGIVNTHKALAAFNEALERR